MSYLTYVSYLANLLQEERSNRQNVLVYALTLLHAESAFLDWEQLNITVDLMISSCVALFKKLPKFSALKQQPFYYISGFVDQDIEQGLAGQFFSVCYWLWTCWYWSGSWAVLEGLGCPHSQAWQLDRHLKGWAQLSPTPPYVASGSFHVVSSRVVKLLKR